MSELLRVVMWDGSEITGPPDVVAAGRIGADLLAPAPTPAVGDTVWLKGWGNGPFLAMEPADERGKLGLTEVDGDGVHSDDPDYDEATDDFFWWVRPECLTTEPPPAPAAPPSIQPVCNCKPSPWTPELLLRLSLSLAVTAFSVAAVLVALS